MAAQTEGSGATFPTESPTCMAVAEPNQRPDPVVRALARCRSHFVAAAAFAAIGNLLLLTPSIYMMQVYNRVIPTGGLMTLAAISAVALFALLTLSLFDWLRGRLLIRAGNELDLALAAPMLELIATRPALGRTARAEAMRNVDLLRQTISSPAASALFDAPWTPIYILAAFLLHPALGALAFGASLLMLLFAWHNERAVRGPLRQAGEAASNAYAAQAHIASHAAEVRALGLATALTRRQLTLRGQVSTLQTDAAFAGGNHAAALKFFRLTLQSAALALGAVLVVEGSVSGGAVFASSLLISRALQPIEQIVAAWKPLLQARLAAASLSALFADDETRHHTALAPPTGAIEVERLTVANPISGRIALAEASFSVKAGEIVGVVGPSGSGKSTLLATIAGAALPARGHVRLDGASTADWDQERLARHIGYLPQSFILFPGTVKENISRFRGALGEDPEQLDAATIAAAETIGAHDMILRLPMGYDTPIGTGGIGLSAGQTQRIAIARALFGEPSLLLLDEATAHLDADSQAAFTRLLAQLRNRGSTVLLATHSNDVLACVDKLLILKEGRVERMATMVEPLAGMRPAAHPVGHVAQRVSS